MSMDAWKLVEGLNKALGIVEYKKVVVLKFPSKGLSRADIQFISIGLKERYCRLCKCFFNVQPKDCIDLNCPAAIQLARLQSLLNV